MSNSEQKKRPRTTNFTDADRALLLKITNDLKATIECKKTDACTWRDKESAWKKVEEQFNASTNGVVGTHF